MRVPAASPSRTVLCCVCLSASLLVLSAPQAYAQRTMLRGAVLDSDSAPIVDADVGIAALRKLARTDEQGLFALTGLKQGEFDLSVRRLGYEPQMLRVVLVADTTLMVVLKAQPWLISAIEVSAPEHRLRQGLEDFHRRRVQGLGTYVTRQEIGMRSGGTPSDILRNVPGLQFVRVRGAGRGVRFVSASSMRRDCMPMIWIDGQRAPGIEIDDVSLSDIEGIELYHGPATTPMQFSQGPAVHQCGVIVLWSRPPPPPGASQPR